MPGELLEELKQLASSGVPGPLDWWSYEVARLGGGL